MGIHLWHLPSPFGGFQVAAESADAHSAGLLWPLLLGIALLS